MTKNPDFRFRFQDRSITNESSLTKTHNAECVSAYPCRPSGGITQSLRSSYLLAIADHVRQPVRPTVQVQDQTHGGVGNFLHSVARDVAHSNTCNSNTDWTVQCFTSPPTQYRLYGRRFLQVKRPNQQYQSTEGDATKEKVKNENN